MQLQACIIIAKFGMGVMLTGINSRMEDGISELVTYLKLISVYYQNMN
jgi:hypothetical protein